MNFQHFYFYYEICALLDQKAYHFIKGKPYELEFGDIVLIHPDLLHKTEYPSGEPSKRLIINFFLSKICKFSGILWQIAFYI
jgi:hypothetical protein